jgi:hypothetical protein
LVATVLVGGTYIVDQRAGDGPELEMRSRVVTGTVANRTVSYQEDFLPRDLLEVRYEVDGRERRIFSHAPGNQERRISIGDPVPVRYLPERPETASLVLDPADSPVQRRHREEGVVVLLALLLGLPALLLRRAARREAAMLRKWRLYPAQVVAVDLPTRVIGESPKVEIRFSDEGTERRERLAVLNRARLGNPGDTVYVLRDPEDAQNLRLVTDQRYVELGSGPG